ncbi:hypothetical protein [Bradyrhizobium mercantei]|uniref:hypothetical protein n=1 Tax=Bradyrhizobium mercantei TaxID=1904807 RepID=UPI0011785896|nr:hypothetical protein [Bradyrhizobium mercantei]
MPDIANLDRRKRHRPTLSLACGTAPIDSFELCSAHRQKAREALQEAVFALQITHARTSIVIGKIENPENRKQLQAQSRRIGTLIDLAWCRLGDI